MSSGRPAATRAIRRSSSPGTGVTGPSCRIPCRRGVEQASSGMASTTIPAPTTTLSVDQIELGNPDTALRDDVDGIFRLLRAERPIGFDREFPAGGMDPGPGFWSLTRHRD